MECAIEAPVCHRRRKSTWLTRIDATGAVAMAPADHLNLFRDEGLHVDVLAID